jgi:hypothetical protein
MSKIENVQVASMLPVYFANLIKAGAVSFDAQGVAVVDANVMSTLRKLHKELAKGDQGTEDKLNNNLDDLMTETNDLLPKYPDVLAP